MYKLSINGFKHFLVNEIKSKSFCSYDKAWEEVQAFSKTKEFEKSFNQWKSMQTTKKKNNQGPIHIKNIFNSIFE